MDSSLIGISLSSIGGKGCDFVSGTGWYINPDSYVGFRTIDQNAVIETISGNLCNGISYFNGKTISHPYEFIGPFNVIKLTSGILQVIK